MLEEWANARIGTDGQGSIVVERGDTKDREDIVAVSPSLVACRLLYSSYMITSPCFLVYILSRFSPFWLYYEVIFSTRYLLCYTFGTCLGCFPPWTSVLEHLNELERKKPTQSAGIVT